jgi:hypothetical protein
MAKLNTETIARLRQVVIDGTQVLQECEDLKAGLTDTVKAIAEELEVKPAQLMKVIKTAHKTDLNQKREDFEELEEMLNAIGRGI